MMQLRCARSHAQNLSKGSVEISDSGACAGMGGAVWQNRFELATRPLWNPGPSELAPGSQRVWRSRTRVFRQRGQPSFFVAKNNATRRVLKKKRPTNTKVGERSLRV